MADPALELALFRKAYYDLVPDFDGEPLAKILNTLFAWVWCDDGRNQLKADYGKGFLFYGAPGNGKTTLLQGLQRYMNSVTYRYQGKLGENPTNRHYWDWRDKRLTATLLPATELATRYGKSGIAEITQYGDDSRNLILDDMGREPIPAQSYGNRLNVVQYILQARYDGRLTRITHATTNLQLDQIEPLYGSHIADRFKQLFNIVSVDNFNDQSFR